MNLVKYSKTFRILDALKYGRLMTPNLIARKANEGRLIKKDEYESVNQRLQTLNDVGLVKRQIACITERKEVALYSITDEGKELFDKAAR